MCLTGCALSNGANGCRSLPHLRTMAFISIKLLPLSSKRFLHLRARVAHRLVAVSFTPSHTAPPDVLKEQQFLQLFSTICEATEKPKPQHYGTLLPTSATERVAGMTCLSFHQNNPNISCMKRRSQSQSLLLLMEPLAGKSVQTLYQCSAV